MHATQTEPLEHRITPPRASPRLAESIGEMALVVEHRDKSIASEIVGIGRLSRLHGVNETEFALVVSDECQGQGIGTELLKRLVQIGRDEKLERITATILADNREMQRVARKAGFTLTQQPSAGECFAEILL